MFPNFIQPDNKMNERSFSFSEDPMTDLGPLLDLLAGLEDAAARAHAAGMRDPATVKASGKSFAAFADICANLPEVRVSRANPPVGTEVDGLGDEFPYALLTATRMGWAAAVASLLPTAIARGGNPMTVGTELTALQTALSIEPAPKLAPTSRTLVWTDGSARLWQCSEGEGVPTVVVASFINRHYLLDLLDGQSLMQTLPGPVYLLDWSVGDEDLDGVLALLDSALSRFEKVKLFGYSMGGTLATIHTARNPEQVERLAVFGSPIDASQGGKFTDWTGEADLDAITSAWSAVPAQWVHAPFWALRPTVNLLKLTQLVRRWREPGYLERFLAVELWNNDNVDVASALYKSWGERIYRDNALWEGELADLGAITCPTLALAARHDGIVPAAATLALADKTGGTATTVTSGHVGALSGRKGLSELSTALSDFLGA
jgi:polyhydroxyalkanoate synthase